MDRKLQYDVLGEGKEKKLNISDHGDVVPLLCPGDRSCGVRAGLRPGQDGLTMLSLTDLHPQASPLI